MFYLLCNINCQLVKYFPSFQACTSTDNFRTCLEHFKRQTDGFWWQNVLQKMRFWLKTTRIRAEHTTMSEFWPEIPTKLSSNLVEFKNYLVHIVINIYLWKFWKPNGMITRCAAMLLKCTFSLNTSWWLLDTKTQTTMEHTIEITVFNLFGKLPLNIAFRCWWI